MSTSLPDILSDRQKQSLETLRIKQIDSAKLEFDYSAVLEALNNVGNLLMVVNQTPAVERMNRVNEQQVTACTGHLASARAASADCVKKIEEIWFIAVRKHLDQ